MPSLTVFVCLYIFYYYRPSCKKYHYYAIYHCILAFFVRRPITSALPLTSVYCIANYIVASSVARLIFTRASEFCARFRPRFFLLSLSYKLLRSSLSFLVQVALPSSLFLYKLGIFLFWFVFFFFHSHKLHLFLIIIIIFFCSEKQHNIQKVL